MKSSPQARGDALDDASGKPGAVVQAPAPLVVAPVGPAGPELIKQRMMGGPELGPVEARLAAADRGGNVGRDQFLDLGFGYPVAAVAAVMGRPARRRPMGLEAEIGIAVRTNVIDFQDDDGSRRANRFRYFQKSRNRGVVLGAEIAAC